MKDTEKVKDVIYLSGSTKAVFRFNQYVVNSKIFLRKFK